MEQVLFLVGPTGVGKSEVVFILALKLSAEIISCDSMQVYKGLDIGTAKPPLSWRRRVPHHLIDVCCPEEDFTVAAYSRMAQDKIKEIISRKKLPIVTGGSGLYYRGLLRGIFPGKGADDGLWEKLEKESVEKGNDYLYRRLKELDPEAAKKIHPNNLRRLIRALEVCISEGKPFSSLQKERKGLGPAFDSKTIGLNRERESLYRRIEERVENMFKNELVKEAEGLYNGNRLGRTAMQALGYKEVIGYLKGEYNLEEARRLLCRDTRRFAKRQLTWFRKEPDI